MKWKLIFLLFFFIAGCMEAPKGGKQTKVETSEKPTLDSFFETIVEDQPINEMAPIVSEKKLKVAVILPVSGSYRKIGAEGITSIKLAQSKLGENLEVKIFDTASQRSNIPFISSKLSEEKFDLIIGPVFNFETAELKNLQTQTPILSLSNDKSIQAENVILFGMRQEDQISDTVTFFAQNENKNFVAIFPSNANGTRSYKTFKAAVDANAGEVMRVEFYDESGVSETSRYTSKILNGLVQKKYISKKDGSVASERTINQLKEKNPNIRLEDLFEIEEKQANVLFISAFGKYREEIIVILNEPHNKEKLKNTMVFIHDLDFISPNLEPYDGMYFYANSYLNAKNFYSEFEARSNQTPTKIGSLIYDALFYGVYVNNRVFGTLNIRNLKNEYEGFDGVNGEFFITPENTTRRRGKVMVIRDGNVAMEVNSISTDFNKQADKTLEIIERKPSSVAEEKPIEKPSNSIENPLNINEEKQPINTFNEINEAD